MTVWRVLKGLGVASLTPVAALLSFREDLLEQLAWIAKECRRRHRLTSIGRPPGHGCARHTSAAAALWRLQKEYRASHTTTPLARRSSSVSQPSRMPSKIACTPAATAGVGS